MLALLRSFIIFELFVYWDIYNWHYCCLLLLLWFVSTYVIADIFKPRRNKNDFYVEIVFFPFFVLSLFNNKCLYFLSLLLIVYIAAQSNKNWPTFFVVAFLPLFFNNHAMMLQLFAWVSALRPMTCIVWTNVALPKDFGENFKSSLLQDFSPLYV